jgi:hypothetical protein
VRKVVLKHRQRSVNGTVLWVLLSLVITCNAVLSARFFATPMMNGRFGYSSVCYNEVRTVAKIRFTKFVGSDVHGRLYRPEPELN